MFSSTLCLPALFSSSVFFFVLYLVQLVAIVKILNDKEYQQYYEQFLSLIHGMSTIVEGLSFRP